MFEIKLLYNNIYYLIKTRNLKISDVESGIHVSPGYLSRLKKSDDEISVPNPEIIFNLSNYFKISVETLCTCEIDKIPSTTLYLIENFSNMYINTETDKLVWDEQTQTSFDNDNEHVLKTFIEPYLYNNGCGYYSRFYEKYVLLIGSIFSLKIGNNIFYLTKVKNSLDDKLYAFEIYLYSFDDEQKLDNVYQATNSKRDELFEIIEKLYYLCEMKARIPKISSSTKKGFDALNSFLNTKK